MARRDRNYNKPEPIAVGDRIIITDRRGSGFQEDVYYRVAKVRGSILTTECGKSLNKVNAVFVPTPEEIQQRLDQFCSG